MLSMFKEKDCEGQHRAAWSMTRVVAFFAAVTMNFALVVMAKKDHVHDIAWPFCVMYVITLLAVPVQMLFKMVQSYLVTGPGKKLLNSMIEKAVVTVGGAISGATTVETKVTQGEPVG
jgi:surface polysaccharide O-acyltransferase-like enzyme